MFACYLWVSVPPEWTAPTIRRWAWARERGREAERGRAWTRRARRDWDHFTLTRWYLLKKQMHADVNIARCHFRLFFHFRTFVGGTGNHNHHSQVRCVFLLLCKRTACAEKCVELLPSNRLYYLAKANIVLYKITTLGVLICCPAACAQGDHLKH